MANKVRLKVRLYDHRGHSYPNIATIPRDQITGHLKTGLEVDKLQDANLVIGHFDENEITEIIAASTKYYFDPKVQIIVFLTAGMAGYEEAQYRHQKQTIADRSRYLLYIRRMSILEQNSQLLPKILSLTPQQAEDIIANRHDWPEDPFSIPRSYLLPALAILCQGYLAVYAEWASRQDRPATVDYQSICKKISWQPGNPQFADLANRFAEVNQKGWWCQPFITQEHNFERQWQDFVNEINRDCAQVDQLQSLLEALAPAAGASITEWYEQSLANEQLVPTIFKTYSSIEQMLRNNE